MKKNLLLFIFAVLSLAAAITFSFGSIHTHKTCPPVDPLDYTVLLPNPEDCETYFICSRGVPILQRCPHGLYFDDRRKACTWPQESDCAKEKEKPSNNNGGDGSKYYYEHLESNGPKPCSISKCVNANGEVKFVSEGGTIGAGWTITSVKSGLMDLCKDKGSGCTAYNDCSFQE